MILVVSKHLFIGIYETFYLREKLGEGKFMIVLLAFGFNLHGKYVCSPLEVRYNCFGVCDSPHYKTQECTGAINDPLNYPNFVGAQVTTNAYQHPFHGTIVCQHCLRKMEIRELDFLRNVTMMTPGQQFRKAKLEGGLESELVTNASTKPTRMLPRVKW